jgi:hypothetical protein
MEKKDKLTDKIDFLTDVYKLRIQFFSEHTSRMWTRFNFLLTAEIGLLGFFLSAWAEPLWQSKVWLFSIIGLFLSAVWYLLGVQDRYYFEGYRKQIQYLEDQFAREYNIEDIEKFQFGNPLEVEPDIFTWRWKSVSLSRLPGAIPLGFFIFWLIVKFFVA